MDDRTRERIAEQLDAVADILARSAPEPPHALRFDDLGSGRDKRPRRHDQETFRPDGHRREDNFNGQMAGAAHFGRADPHRKAHSRRNNTARPQARGECIIMTRLFFVACVCAGVLVGAVIGAEVAERLIDKPVSSRAK